MTKQQIYNLKYVKLILYFGGLFNIAFAIPLTFPGLSERYFQFFSKINDGLDLGGSPIEYPSQGVAQLLINTTGASIVLIGSIVVLAGTDPHRYRAIPMMNALGRLAFIALIFFYIWEYDVARVMALFAPVDFVLSLLFIFFFFRLERADISAAPQGVR